MSTTSTPNMGLIVPGVGNESGPDYATDINSDLSIIDQHDHTPGSGVPLTPSSFNINTNLTFNGHFAIDLAGVTFTAQLVTPDIFTVYSSGDDLYYVDGLGNNIQITDNGGIAGSPGSISNLTSPASASYVSAASTFVWQSNTNIAANMDAGSVLLRNLSPNSTFAVTLSAPAALASNWELFMPAIPASQKIMTLDAAGVISAPYVVDNSTIEVNSNTIRVKALGITSSQIANGTITTTQISNSAGITGTQIANTTITAAKIANATITGTQIASDVNLAGTQVQANSKRLVVCKSSPSSTYLAILRSIVNGSTGAILSGEGITAVRNGTGNYTVTFVNAFSDAPATTVTVTDDTTIAFAIVPPTSTGSTCTVKMYDVTGTLVDADFSIIAIGQN